VVRPEVAVIPWSDEWLHICRVSGYDGTRSQPPQTLVEERLIVLIHRLSNACA